MARRSRTSAAALRLRRSKAKSDIFVLSDLTQVIEYFKKSLNADQWLDMPDFVVHCTTPIFLGMARGVEIDPQSTASRHRARA
jgi:hypothetical protein